MLMIRCLASCSGNNNDMHTDIVNNPSTSSPTKGLLQLLLPLNNQV